MNNRQKLEAEDQRNEIFRRDEYRCRHCGLSVYSKGTPQLAHGIAKTKTAIKKYGDSVVNHPMNLFSTCSLYCNSRMNIGNNPVKVIELVEKIRDKMLTE